MQELKKRIKPFLSDQERMLLTNAFPQFLEAIERRGAGFTELQALLGILGSLKESDRINEALEELLARMMSLLTRVVPDRLTLEEASEIYGVNAATLRRACWKEKLAGEKHG